MKTHAKKDSIIDRKSRGAELFRSFSDVLNFYAIEMMIYNLEEKK